MTPPEEKEIASVLALLGPARYEHFIKRAADLHEVWSLRGDHGWIMMGDDEGHECMPLWPHEAYAALCAGSSERPAVIPLSAFREKWLPGMARDHRLVAVFPVPAGPGVMVSPLRLGDDLSRYLAEWYGEE